MGYAFVDDTDLIVTATNSEEHAENVRVKLQLALDYWEGLLKATGGALEETKCFWYLIDFVWTGIRWRYADISETPGEITVNNKDDTDRVTLQCYEADHAEKLLGVMIAMDGNNKAQVEYLKEKGHNFADHIKAGSLSQNDVWTALLGTIMRTFAYPMPATTLTKQEWVKSCGRC